MSLYVIMVVLMECDLVVSLLLIAFLATYPRVSLSTVVSYRSYFVIGMLARRVRRALHRQASRQICKAVVYRPRVHRGYLMNAEWDF